MFVGRHVSEVLRSTTPVEEGDRVPCDGKDTTDNHGLETTVAPGIGQVGIRSSPPKKGDEINSSTKVHACNMNNKMRN